jgi:hypothetical protein
MHRWHRRGIWGRGRGARGGGKGERREHRVRHCAREFAVGEGGGAGPPSKRAQKRTRGVGLMPVTTT